MNAPPLDTRLRRLRLGYMMAQAVVTGKSHLSVALGSMRACEAATKSASPPSRKWPPRFAPPWPTTRPRSGSPNSSHPDLIILDELGFTPLDRLLADAFYRIVASRYERASIVTSKKSVESWAEVFPDAAIASAVLDRLVHHAHLVPIVGESYRMKELKAAGKEARLRRLGAPQSFDRDRRTGGSRFMLVPGSLFTCSPTTETT